MNQPQKEALLEGLKELVRMTILAVGPVLIAQLEQGGSINWRVIVVIEVVAVLRALDKWAHESKVKSPLDLKGMDTLIQ